ncbi:MAG: dephospho-CoA kinase [Actinomycetota bacterium]|nr:dephospho-CoA kinase [Actinomycetota bacterium]MDH4016870.1 dephospho-CoA kinase [Actinomycetota bacterium]
MIRVGLTGGIGAGKSTVGRMLAELGAVIVDGDQIARDLVVRGEPALAEIVERFGPDVLLPDGELDRAGLAELVFPEPESLASLDAIMHPRIAERAQAMLADAQRNGTSVIVYDMPLLVESGAADDFDVVMVVHAPVEVRLARLAVRGVAVDDARNRMAQQASDEERAAVATILIDNGGDDEQLIDQVQRAWYLLQAALGE